MGLFLLINKEDNLIRLNNWKNKLKKIYYKLIENMILKIFKTKNLKKSKFIVIDSIFLLILIDYSLINSLIIYFLKTIRFWWIKNN